MLSGKNHIGFEISSEGDVTFKTFNPLLNIENSTVFHEASKAEINRAVDLAYKASNDFRNMPGIRKADFLRAIGKEIMQLDDELISCYCSETGLPEGRAKGERARTIFQLNSFAELVEEGSWVEASIDTGIPEREPVPKPDLRKMMVALGPVVVFGASNFPLAYSTAGGDTAAALAAGCPVIVKSHPMHAGTGELVASAIVKAAKDTAMPEGVFSNLNSSGIEVGVQLVKHPHVKAVGFTGSIKGGRALFDLAADREEPIPVFAEMGSINPVILLPKRLKNNSSEIAQTYAGSITLGTGQFCTNPGLIIGFKGEELEEFEKVLSEEILKKDPSVMLHPNIHSSYESKKDNAQSQTDVSTLAEYEMDVEPNYAKQAVVSVSGKRFLENPKLHQEVFGPFSMIVECASKNELIEIINNLEGQLTGTIIGEKEEVEEHLDVMNALQNRVGRLIYNGVPTGVEVCPSMIHGGPYPASTDSRFTAVGIHSIKRWVRPVSFQDWPDNFLPDALKNSNPLNISRLVNGNYTNSKI